MNDDSIFDWLEIANRLVYIRGPFDKELMKLIKIHHIYIDTNGNIEDVITEKCNVLLNENDGKSSVITREEMEKITSARKNNLEIRYKVLEIILYNVNIDVSQIQYFSNNISTEMPKNFLSSLSMTKDIKIPETLFIFHQTNGIYILYERICSTILSKTKRFHTCVAKTKKIRVNMRR